MLIPEVFGADADVQGKYRIPIAHLSELVKQGHLLGTTWVQL